MFIKKLFNRVINQCVLGLNRMNLDLLTMLSQVIYMKKNRQECFCIGYVYQIDENLRNRAKMEYNNIRCDCLDTLKHNCMEHNLVDSILFNLKYLFK